VKKASISAAAIITFAAQTRRLISSVRGQQKTLIRVGKIELALGA
jgi:hypothetical protein